LHFHILKTGFFEIKSEPTVALQLQAPAHRDREAKPDDDVFGDAVGLKKFFFEKN